jgi:hypothetical protein
MCSVAVFLFISGVTAGASAHDNSLFSFGLSPNLIGRGKKRPFEHNGYFLKPIFEGADLPLPNVAPRYLYPV